MFRLLGLTFVLCVVGQPSLGNDSGKVLGTWKLVSYETEVQATGQKEPALGQSPSGYVAFNSEGRVFLNGLSRLMWRGFPSGSAPNKCDLSRWTENDCKCYRYGG
jgi:hypothetical protein